MHVILQLIPKKWLIIGMLSVVGFFTVLTLGSVSLVMQDDGVGTGDVDYGTVGVSADVLAWEPVIRKYAKEFEVEEYVALMMAQMQQESGGKGNDPMCSSEGAFNTKYPKKPNGITDPDYSIWAGVQEFKHAKERAGVMSPTDIERIKLALQSYNFGTGFFGFIEANGGKYTMELTIQFSQEQYEKVKDTGMYRCVRPEAIPYQACYGDILYADAVLKYYSPLGGSIGESGAQIIDVGRQWIGRSTYVFGGGRTLRDIEKGIFDCSSFVRWSFEQVGINVGTLTGVSTETLNKIGTKISPTEMKTGDLIFFDTYKRDGHVGIVIDENSWIGCQTSKGVAIESLSNSYWKKSFKGHVRRP